MKHATNSELRSFLEQDLPPARLLEFDDHFAACPQCRAALEREDGAGGKVAALQDAFAAAEPHLEYEQLRRMADGEPVSPEVGRHSASCAACASELEELRQFSAQLAATPRFSVVRIGTPAAPKHISFWRLHPVWSGLAAAVLLATVAGFYGRMAQHLPPVEPIVASLRDGAIQLSLDKSGRLHGDEDLAQEERDDLKAALQTGRLVAHLPNLGSRRPETMLGAPMAAASFNVLSPLDQVVTKDRPSFVWEAMHGATGYRVRVYGAGYRKIVESPLLDGTQWQSAISLPRGESYTWTVTAESRHGEVRQPALPQPEAAFKIMAADAAAALNAAAQSHANDPLLLAVLYARAGAIDDARAQINLLAAQNPDNPRVAQLRASLAQGAPSPIKTNAAQ